jgi:TonB family protein
MASAEEVRRALPDTLPEDFSQWDHEDSPAARPVDSSSVAASNGFAAVTQPPALSAKQQAIAAPNADVLRREPAPQPPSVRSEYEFLRQASPERQAIAGPRADVGRNGASPVRRTSVHLDYESLRPAPRSNGAAPDHPPVAASRGQAAIRTFSDVSSSQLSHGDVVVEEVRFAPEPAPLSARVNEEDFLERLKSIGTAYNSQPATAPQKQTAARVTAPVSVAPDDEPDTAEGSRRILELIEEASAADNHNEIGALSFHSDLADLGDEDPDRKKWVRIGAASFAALVLLVFVGPRLLHPSKHASAAQSAELRPASAVMDPAANTPRPSLSTATAAGRASAKAETHQTSMTQPATNVEETISPRADSNPAPATHGATLTSRGAKDASPQVDSTLMNDQLASAPLIPQDVKTLHKAEEAPPSPGFDAANTAPMSSGAGAADGVFTAEERPSVKYVPPPPVVVPVDVADKLLIHKTLPSFPAGAWKHYASGKVVLEAIVSETGSVEHLKVVSGPREFQQSAVNAVKTWRYKPYLVNDKPARVQTTVTLIFDPYKN